MKLAIVADWLVTFGGAEHTLAAMRSVWPDAPLYTTVAKREALGPLRDADIRTTRLQFLYKMSGKHQVLLPLMPRAIESIDLRGYDVILSSSHAVAKGIVPPATAVHVCYCHTPMRYAWEMENEYLRDFRVPKILRGFIRRQLKALRRWDLSTAKRVDLFIANSTETQQRIARIYGRDSVVIPPPVDDRFFSTELQNTEKRTDYLAVGRLVPYKKFDVLIHAANAKGFSLVIAGRGQEEAALKRIAGPTVRFLGFVPDADLPHLYAQSKALLFPPYEDAGIVPLEAQAAGTPVIALGKGGALDTVIDGKTGTFFADQTPEAIIAAIERFEKMTLSPDVIREHAGKFSSKRFCEEMERVVRGEWEKRLEKR